MGLYKRGQMWWMAYTAHGRKVNESTRTSNKRLAQRILDKRRGEIAEGRFLLLRTSECPRLRDHGDVFLQSVAHENTRKRYRSSVGNLLPVLGDFKLSEIGEPEIEDFITSRLESGTAPATVNRDLAVLRRILRNGMKKRWVGENPFLRVELLNETAMRRQARVLSLEEELRLMPLIPQNSPLRPLLIIQLEAGLRVRREALQLRWDDVDFAFGEIGAIHVRESKTPAGRRTIPMSQYCKTELLRWKGIFGPEFSPYVFPNPNRNLVPYKDLRNSWNKVKEAAGLEGLWFHDLRATFASRLNAAGVPELQIAYLLGHSSSRIVSTYAKAVWESHLSAIKKLSEIRRPEQNSSVVASTHPIQ